MEPMFPSEQTMGKLANDAIAVIKESAALGSMLRPVTRERVVRLLRQMNSYYSNLIEGHNTHPISIEKALKGDYSTEPAKRALQLESKAHIEVQRLIEERLETERAVDICSKDFLCWVHREFYERMPDEYRVVRDEDTGVEYPFSPGDLRTREVKVGQHKAPLHRSVPAFLDRFRDVYSPAKLDPLQRVVAAAASHHRLAWIHPFIDGNGRVIRLFTDAYLVQAGIHGHGLWTMTRGLARRRDDYMQSLALADETRRNAYDGRGNLTEGGLTRFCEFFFATAIDQIRFMSGLLDLDGLEDRIFGFVDRQAATRQMRPQSAFLLREALLRGNFARGEAARVTGMAERTARQVVGALLDDGLLVSDSPKGSLQLGLPAHAVGYYFPRLYPDAIESSFDRNPASRETKRRPS